MREIIEHLYMMREMLIQMKIKEQEYYAKYTVLMLHYCLQVMLIKLRCMCDSCGTSDIR